MSTQEGPEKYCKIKKQIKNKISTFKKKKCDLNDLPSFKFIDEMKDQPVLMYIVEVVGEIAIIGYENQLYKWYLKSMELKELLPHIQLIAMNSFRTNIGRFIQVTFKGKVKKGKHYVNHFEIQKMTPPYNTKWVDITTDLSFLHGEKDVITVKKPKIMGWSSVISFPDDHDTSSKVRDIMIKLGFPAECVSSKSLPVTMKQRKNWERLLINKSVEDITREDAVQCYLTQDNYSHNLRIWDTPEKKDKYDSIMKEFMKQQSEVVKEFERNLFEKINKEE